MKNRTLANCLCVTIILKVIGLVLDEQTLILFTSLALWILAIWIIVRLYKMPDVR